MHVSYLSGHNDTHAVFVLVTDPTARYPIWAVITPVMHLMGGYTIYWLIYRDHLCLCTQQWLERVELIELMRGRVFGISSLKLTYITSKTFISLPPIRKTLECMREWKWMALTLSYPYYPLFVLTVFLNFTFRLHHCQSTLRCRGDFRPGRFGIFGIYPLQWDHVIFLILCRIGCNDGRCCLHIRRPRQSWI